MAAAFNALEFNRLSRRPGGIHSASRNNLREAAVLEKLMVILMVKKFSCLSWNPKVHFRDHDSPAVSPIPKQTNTARIPNPSCQNNFNIIFSRLGISSVSSLSLVYYYFSYWPCSDLSIGQ
jgi:hypothetical protein